MMETLADRGDRRPCAAVIGNRNEEFIGQTELERLEDRLDLTVVHVLSDASEHWTGLRGRVDAALLNTVCACGEPRCRCQYFICGPDPMMDAVEASLLSLGVPAERIHSERFAMV
jgi:ferredoxin-NADP reductase